jgi:intraflagellar transport protein 74
MTGMRTGHQGPGRQIQDKSYYLGELRAKTSEINKELEKMRTEIDQFQKDNSTYNALERRYESLVREVRTLQGQLADYNLIVDKVRTNAEPADIEQQYQHLKHKNDSDRRRIDAVFTERSTKESQTRDIEQQIGALKQTAEKKLNELAPEKRQRYQQLSEQNSRLLDRLGRQQEEYDALCRSLAQFEVELNREPLKHRMFQLEQQRTQLRQRKGELDEDTGGRPLSVPEVREKLLQKVKEDNALIATLDRQMEELQKQISKYRDQIQQYDLDLDEAKGEQSEKKVQELLQKDKEMQDFIDAFEETKATELEQNKKTQNTIVALLEHVSQNILRQNNMPSQSRLAEMQDDLAYKEQQMSNAHNTHERLGQELELRNMELEKINTLDTKINVELTSLNDRMKTMREELITFQNLDGLRDAAEARKKQLKVLKAHMSTHKEALKLQVQNLAAKYEARKQKLTESESASSLEALEQKLRHYEQNIFNLSEYIESKTRESEYEPLRKECESMITQLNQVVIHNIGPGR